MTSIRLNEPAVEPISLTDMRAHLRLTGTEEDSVLAGFIKAARTHIEQSTRRALISQSWRLYLDAWPIGRIVKFPIAPVSSVDQVTIYDFDGAPTSLAADDWRLDRSNQPERLKIKVGAGLSASQLMAAEVDFTVGYGMSPEDVPEEFRQAIRLLVAHWFEHREAGTDMALASLPFGLDRLLSTARVPLL